MKRIHRASLTASLASLVILAAAAPASAAYRTPDGVTYDTSVGALCGDLTTTVFFHSGDSGLELQETPTLDYVASCLTTGALAGRRVAAVGYTDPSGSDAVDFELGEARAQAVVDYLVSKGVDREQLLALSLGDSTTVKDRADRAAWAGDRRVELWVVHDGQVPPKDPGGPVKTEAPHLILPMP